MFYLNTFFLFSIIGYGYEMMTSFLMHQKKETLLLGPWMPIYGIGLLVTHYINERLEKKGIHRWKKVLYCYFISVIALTLLEEIGGLLTQFMFAKSFWNYESIPLSIGPYINVFVSLVWGLFAILLEFVVYPIFMPFIQKIPKFVSYILIALFLIDNFWALKNNLVWLLL